MSMNSLANSLFAKAALVLFISISLLFSFFFVVYDSTNLIFYSSIIFIVLAFVIAYDRKLIEYTLLLSISTLISSSIVYFSAYNVYYLIGVLLIFLVLLAMSRRIGIKGEHLFFIFLALFMPILFSTVPSNFGYMVNIAILGYYLLISAVIAVLLRAFAVNNGLVCWARRIKARVTSHMQMGLAIFVFASAAALISPIWPTGAGINYNALPYAPILLTSYQGGAGNYTLFFNASAYSAYENKNLSNIRFISTSGSVINATILSNSSAASTRTEVLLGLPFGVDTIMLKFLPANVSFDSHLRLVNMTHQFKGIALPAVFGNVTGGLNYTNRTIMHVTYAMKSMTLNTSGVSLPPYSSTGLQCAPGKDASASVSVISNVTLSLFLFNVNTSAIDASGSTYAGAPYAAYVNRSQYQFYISNFTKHSNSYVLNETSMSLNFSFHNASCVQYVLAFDQTAKFKIHTMMRYLGYVVQTTHRWMPAMPNLGYGYINPNFGFLPYSVEYVIRESEP